MCTTRRTTRYSGSITVESTGRGGYGRTRMCWDAHSRSTAPGLCLMILPAPTPLSTTCLTWPTSLPTVRNRMRLRIMLARLREPTATFMSESCSQRQFHTYCMPFKLRHCVCPVFGGAERMGLIYISKPAADHSPEQWRGGTEPESTS